MKQKKFDKRLVLNKKTVANLSNDDLMHVLGGIPPTYETTCCTPPDLCAKTYQPCVPTHTYPIYCD